MFPKQFIAFDGDHGSLLGQTLKRLKGDFALPIVVCSVDHRFLVREELLRAGLEPAAILLEPTPRNTAAAVAVAALTAVRKDPNAVIAVMPSDHIVKDGAAFVRSIGRAAIIALTGRLVLLGIPPTAPNTGYGYIRRGEVIDGDIGAFAVSQFAEKPDLDTAKQYISDGSYLWNSGVVVLGARAFLSELARYAPQVLTAARGAVANAIDDLGFARLDLESFSRAPNISIDRAVMEKTKLAAVIAIDVGWSDVGTWSSLWDSASKDDKGNVVYGDAILADTTNCIVHSDRSFVATIGLNRLIIVNTADALLVADQGRSQEVSEIAKRLQELGRKERDQHTRSYRPWGFFEHLGAGSRFQVKLLNVKPGGRLSMQMHHHRSEHWVVVRGTAKVTVGETERLVQENESVYITATHWHRLENPGKVPLELIEVQIGSYLGEDDIIRGDDIYSRGPDETR